VVTESGSSLDALGRRPAVRPRAARGGGPGGQHDAPGPAAGRPGARGRRGPAGAGG